MEGSSMRRFRAFLAGFVSFLALAAGPVAADQAGTFALPAKAVKHVLLISVDGLHEVDLARFIAAHPQSALAGLAAHGAHYRNAAAAMPSDSFPGLLAMITGGTPKSTGVYYDDSYDRTLYPPGSRREGGGDHQPDQRQAFGRLALGPRPPRRKRGERPGRAGNLRDELP